MIIRVGPRAGERGQLRTPYVQRELAAAGANDDAKQPQRDRVAAFFARHQAGAHPRCFCLPGCRWAFERTLQRAVDRPVGFVGVERNFAVIDHGLRHMPGFHLVNDRCELRHRVLTGFSSSQARVVWADASTLMAVSRTDHLNTNRRKDWIHQYLKWTCAWLDFCGTIGDEVATCMKRLENCLDAREVRVPVAVTFLIGREDPGVTRLMDRFCPDGSPLDRRVTYLRLLWESNRFRTAEVADAWTFSSAGGVSMGVVTAVFTSRRDQ